MFEELELVCKQEAIGNALRPGVVRAAITIAAKACGRDAVSPIDLEAVDVDVSLEQVGGRTIAGVNYPPGPAYIYDRYQQEEIHRYRRNELLNYPMFDAPSIVPDFGALRNGAVFWAGDEAVLIYRKNDQAKSLPTVDMDYIARWPCLCHAVGAGGTHQWWAQQVQKFVEIYQHMMEWDQHLKRLMMPANITCVIHSNLARCFDYHGHCIGWTERAREDLKHLAKLLQCFRSPIYICSAKAERWELHVSFDDAVLMAHSILVDYPNIMICRGEAFWATIKPFLIPIVACSIETMVGRVAWRGTLIVSV